MARKNLLSGLMPSLPNPAAPAAGRPAPPAAPRGAVGAVARTFSDLKARSVLEIDAHSIDAAGLQDRLEHDPEEDEALRRSIEEHGQQVPILVRPHPTDTGRYQIVYGRRRVLALRDLGRPVRALVRDLDDRELLIAQGTENTARRDLTFIEKCNFARQMVAAGYDRKVVCDALHVDKTLISRMLSVADRVPVEVIERVGSAPGIGRDRWLAVADRIEELGFGAADLLDFMAAHLTGSGPDRRFRALEEALAGAMRRRAPPRPSPAPRRTVPGGDGKALGSARVTDRAVMLRLDRARAPGFGDWLLENMAALHRDWLARGRD